MYRPPIEKVFTPRNHIVNDDMYVNRPKLEKDLLRAVRGSMHIMLFGESGNGKSWLYKHVFSKNKIPFKVANCGNASRLDSMTAEIYKTCIPDGHLTKLETEDTKEAGIKAFAEAKLANKNKYGVKGDEPLLAAFKALSKKNETTVLVIDNLEAIVGNQDLIDELCNIILLSDDERYAECNVKLLIVGTPNGVSDFFGHTKNLPSIANRLTEMSKVAGLQDEEVATLIEHGFRNKLKISLSSDDFEFLKGWIIFGSLKIAQRVQEICSEIAHEIKDAGWIFTRQLVGLANHNWLTTSLRASYAVIESHLNSKETTVGRRNQVIYAIGKLNKSPVHTSDIESFIRREFPSTIPTTNMGIGSILSELCEGHNAILKKSEKGAHYNPLDPLHIMTIRLVLVKNKTTEKVQRRTFKQG